MVEVDAEDCMDTRGNAPDVSGRERSGHPEHETGFEPATSTLATFVKTPKSLRIPA
jgi:hypothetical protein